MNDTKLVAMANQIATFFQAYPEPEAQEALREHIRLFWTPRMRQTLDERMRDNPAGIAPLVMAALAAPGLFQVPAGPIGKPAA